MNTMPVTIALVSGAALGYAWAVLRQRPRPVAKRLRNFGNTLCIATYNVLADGMFAAVGEHKSSTHGGFNNYSTPREREWSQRFPALMAELDAYAADVVCLQEVQHSHYVDSFQPAFAARGYSTILSARGTGERDLCVMLATRDTSLTVLATELISFPHEVGLLADEVRLSAGLVEQARGKDEELLLLLCEQATTRKRLVVATTHLWWNPTQPDIKLLQVRV